jgi:hypothetical protein
MSLLSSNVNSVITQHLKRDNIVKIV